MDKEKQIEEMAKVLCADSVKCKHCPNRGFSKERCNIIRHMRWLQHEGYGNIEQAVREFAEELKKKFDGLNCDEVYFEGDYVDISIVSETLIDQLIKERFGN